MLLKTRSGPSAGAGSVLAVVAAGSLLCSAALKSCNDRFSAVFSPEHVVL